MTATLILWGHSLAALLFGALALWAWRGGHGAMPRLPLTAALSLTALWALAVAGIGEGDLVTRIAGVARNLGWFALLAALYRRGPVERSPIVVHMVLAVIAVVTVMGLSLDLAADGTVPPSRALVSVGLLLKLLATVAALLLVQGLYSASAPRTGPATRPVMLALGALWLVDVNLFSVAWLVESWPLEPVAVRGFALALIALAIGAGLQRRTDLPMQMSRTAIYQVLGLVALGVYVALLAVATHALDAIGGANARLLQTAFVFGSTAAILTLVSSSWLRAWIKVKLAKHFFRHRYDYRAEWMRFTETLGEPDGAASLDERIVKALADLTDSPAGVLLLPQGEGLSFGAGWNVARAELPVGYGESWQSARIDPAHIVELDTGDGADAAPPSIRAWDQAWVVVPLPHQRRVAGVIVLARPPVPRALDWEDFDLLRAAGRQVASHIAEERAQEALAEAERFDEFNRRFAFILHDIKNLVSQLTLVARNAQRHADNPEFRADMVATLQDSAGRMNDLLARLSQTHRARNDPPVALPLIPLLRRIVRARGGTHPIELVAKGDPIAIADPARLETLIGHLVQNAVEASPADARVTLALVELGDRIAIDVIDTGCGMSPGFVRDKLFRPFVSSKAGGFGIGAFEARKLAEEMGGRIDVSSAEGRGTRFRVSLRAAASPPTPLPAQFGTAA